MAQRGNPRFEPTDEQRRLVEKLAALGIRQIDICSMVLGRNGKPIGHATLERHFRKELDSGATKLNFQIGNFLLATILGQEIEQPPGTKPEQRIKPLTDEKSRTSLAQLYARSRLGWRETVEHGNAKDKDGKTLPFVVVMTNADDANL